MINSRTIFTVCAVILIIFALQWMFNIGHYCKTVGESEKEFAERDVGLDQASREELIKQGKSNLQLEQASASDGFEKGSLLDNLNQQREMQKIVSGTWVVKKPSRWSNLAKVKFEGKYYYLYDNSGQQIETGRVQVMRDMVTLLPSNYSGSQKFIELVDRRYMILESDGDRLEFEKKS